MENKKPKTQFWLLICGILIGIVLSSLFHLANQKQTEQVPVESGVKTVENTSEVNKLEAVHQLRDLVTNLSKNIKEDELQKVMTDSSLVLDKVPQEQRAKLFKYDSLDTEEYEKLAWQSLFAVSFIAEKNLNDWADITKDEEKIIVEAIPYSVDTKTLTVPLGLISLNLTGYSIDMVRQEDGSWKIHTQHLINQMQYVDSFLSLDENKTKSEASSETKKEETN